MEHIYVSSITIFVRPTIRTTFFHLSSSLPHARLVVAVGPVHLICYSFSRRIFIQQSVGSSCVMIEVKICVRICFHKFKKMHAQSSIKDPMFDEF